MGNATKTLKLTPILSVLIPTYNRHNNVIELLDSFCANLNLHDKSMIEFVISENVPKSESKLLKHIGKYSRIINIKLVNPKAHLISAEENLFFGWQYITGKFVWTLGDDDPVNFEVLSDLLNRCKNDANSIFKFNANLLTSQNKLAGKVTKSLVSELTFSLRDFLQVVGFWHTGAGFSTWVFRSSLIDPIEGLAWVQSFKSPVYAHVTYFLNACAKEDVTFVDQPLVNYRINSYIDQETGEDHWDIYTSKVNMPRYYPWTLGFIRQLLRLESNGIIDNSYWAKVLGDHVGARRFLEINSMISLTIQQLNLQRLTNTVGLSDSDFYEINHFFRRNRPDLPHLWDMLETLQTHILEREKSYKYLLRRIQVAWYCALFLDPYNFHRKSKFKYSYEIGILEFSVSRKEDIEVQLSLGSVGSQNYSKLQYLLGCCGASATSLLYSFSQFIAKMAPNFVIAAIFKTGKLLGYSKLL